MADKTIGELTPVHIGALPVAPDIYDSTLLAVEQQGEARRINGRQWTNYARAAAAADVQRAIDAADAAEKSRDAAADSAKAAKGSQDAALESERQAKQYSGNPPIIDGEHETWWTWNATRQQYQDTGKPSRGDLLLPGFVVKAENGHLYLVTDTRYNGPKFRLNKNRLEMMVGA